MVPLGTRHVDRLAMFFRTLPSHDLAFIDQDVTDPSVIRGWAGQDGQWIALDHNAISGYMAVLQLPDWSDAIGEIRLVVHPGCQHADVGCALATHRFDDDPRPKFIVEVAANQRHVSVTSHRK